MSNVIDEVRLKSGFGLQLTHTHTQQPDDVECEINYFLLDKTELLLHLLQTHTNTHTIFFCEQPNDANERRTILLENKPPQ